MTTRSGTIDDVRVRETSKGDLFTLVMDGQEFTTFRREIAEAARELKGQQVELEYTEKQNGKYLNRYAEQVLPVRTAPPSGFTRDAGGSDPDRELRIMRQTAGKVAVEHLRYFTPADQTDATLKQLLAWWLDYFQNGLPEQAGAGDDIPF